MGTYMEDSSIVRSPRPATEAERQKVEEVREVQALLRQRIGVGNAAIFRRYAGHYQELWSGLGLADANLPASG